MIFYFGEKRACHIFIKIITDLWDSILITQTLYQTETF